MFSSSVESIDKLRLLGFPIVFERIQVNAGGAALNSFRSPRIFYNTPNKSSLHADASDWLPLWERFGFVLYAFDVHRNYYLIFDYSCQEMEIVAHTYQQYVTYVLLHVAENGGWDELDELATLFDYRYLEKLKSAFEAETDLDFETYCSQVVSEIEG